MSKTRDNDIVLIETEMIKFPSSQMYEDATAGLVITGNSTIDASNLKGVEVNIATLVDQGALTYDSGSGNTFGPGSALFCRRSPPFRADAWIHLRRGRS